MAASTSNGLPVIGFLTVIERGEHGLLGGLLVLNAAGRPLEFHCTAPVKANRAQEILYGPTLPSYLYGEQIGQALYKKCKAEVQLLFTDLPPIMALRDYTNLPVALVVGERSVATGPQSKQLRLDAPHGQSAPPPNFARLQRFELAGHTLATAANYADDPKLVQSMWSPHAEDFDLLEPFERIRDAIDEAQRGGR